MQSPKQHSLKILAVEPLGAVGHQNFNTFMLHILGKLGHVTFTAPLGYLHSCKVNQRVDIPLRLYKKKSKLNVRLSQIQILNFIKKTFLSRDYDIILFLDYETISFFFCWPRKIRCLMIDHNNIDNIQGSRIKNIIYRHLPSGSMHIAFQKNITHRIRDEYKKKAEYVPHPYYRSDTSNSGSYIEKSLNPYQSNKKKVIFSPSSSTPVNLQEDLIKLSSKKGSKYYTICKHYLHKFTDSYETRSFFDNYSELMKKCDFVFIGARFDYRVSGVAFEALSYGKPLIIMDSLFARSLQTEYPYIVFLIEEVSEIPLIEPKPDKIVADHCRFLREHSFDTILANMSNLLDEFLLH